MLVLRLGKRRTSFESPSVEEIVEAEFTTREGSADLNLSVYVVATATVVQAQAEHDASHLRDPPPGRANIDLAGSFRGNVVQTPGATEFSFTRQTHHEVRLATSGDLTVMVRALMVNAPDRLRTVTRQQVVAHAAERLEAGDPEWVSMRDRGRLGLGWMRRIQKGR